MPHSPLITSDCTWHIGLQKAVISGQVSLEQPAYSLEPTLCETFWACAIHYPTWKLQLSSSISRFHSITNAMDLAVTLHTDSHEAGEQKKQSNVSKCELHRFMLVVDLLSWF